MNALTISLVVLQIVLSLILILVVLLQHGTQTGLSGSIAGGAETFFGKNKGRTIDAKLKKWTSVVAILFLLSSIAITFAVKDSIPEADESQFPIESQIPLEDDMFDVSETEGEQTEGEQVDGVSEDTEASVPSEEPVESAEPSVEPTAEPTDTAAAQ